MEHPLDSLVSHQQGNKVLPSRSRYGCWYIIFITAAFLYKVHLAFPFTLAVGSSVMAASTVESTGKKPVQKATDQSARSMLPSHDKQSTNFLDINPLIIGVDEVKILQQLRRRRSEIESKSADQSVLTQETKLVNDILEKNINNLIEIKKQLNKIKPQQKGSQEAMLKMARLYEGMKPNQAAKILEDMDTSVVVPIISLMRKQFASQIIGAMSEKKARLITLQSIRATL